MKTIDLHQVDAFTNVLFGGNPAGVVTNADELSDEDMQHIAREMNVSETAFVLSPTAARATIKFRYFTPRAEVKFCGHATVGALYELARLGLRGLDSKSSHDIQVETNVGVLDMSITPGDDNKPHITFIAPKTHLIDYSLQDSDFADKMGIPAESIKQGGRILFDKGLSYIYIPIDSFDKLSKLIFDFSLIKRNFRDEGIVVFCLYSNEAVDASAHLHARGLAPLVDVDEDPFTGSMQAGLFESAKQNGFLSKDTTEVLVEQGHIIGRPGQARVKQQSKKISVTGSGTHVFSTKLSIK